MELALRLLPVSILVVFPALLVEVGVFSKELIKLYRSSRDDSRAHMSSRGFATALLKRNDR